MNQPAPAEKLPIHLQPLQTPAELEAARPAITEAITQWQDLLRGDTALTVAEMVEHVASCLPYVWILWQGEDWIGVGCLVQEEQGGWSAHGVMRRGWETHPARRLAMRQMVQVMK